MALIAASWKSFTGRRIARYVRKRQGGKRLTGTGRVWQRGYWDRYIRSEQHFRAAVAYDHKSPVKARLVEKPEDWPWSSAGFEGGRRAPELRLGSPRLEPRSAPRAGAELSEVQRCVNMMV